MPVELTDGRRGVDKDLNHTSERKPGLLQIIQYSLAEILSSNFEGTTYCPARKEKGSKLVSIEQSCLREKLGMILREFEVPLLFKLLKTISRVLRHKHVVHLFKGRQQRRNAISKKLYLF
jgi:hypothetical protein